MLSKVITSKQIDKLLEVYSGTLKLYGQAYTFYKNPSFSDFKQLVKEAKEHEDGPKKLDEMKFVANAKDKNVYVADGYWVTHIDILSNLSLPSHDAPWLFYGYARWSGGVAKFDTSLIHYATDEFRTNKKLLSAFLSYDWSFVDNYISGTTSAINTIRN
jgi:hypothetical protein